LLRLEYAGRDDAPARDEIDEAREHVRTALDEVRGIAGGLRPVLLDELGLATALQFLLADARESAALEVQYRGGEAPPLSPEVELVIYRVAQEALTNVARHARASRASVELACEHDDVVLTVADDGAGRAGRTEGTGIRGMRERAVLVGGALELCDADPTGTELRLSIPLTS